MEGWCFEKRKEKELLDADNSVVIVGVGQGRGEGERWKRVLGVDGDGRRLNLGW